MKNTLLTKVLAAVTLFLYVAAVVGFDIHTDEEHGHTYIRSLLSDLSCRSIHPDAPCGHHHDSDCCADCECGDDEDCCSDDSEQFNEAGTTSGMLTVCAEIITVTAPALHATVQALLIKSSVRTISCNGPPRSSLSKNCIFLV